MGTVVKGISALLGILVLSACTHRSVTPTFAVPQLAKRVDPSDERRDGPGRTPSPRLSLDSARALASVPTLLSLGEWRPVGPWIYAGKAFDVAVSPVDPNTVYAAFGIGGGLWKTSDGGQTWLQLTDRSDLTDIGCVSVHPSIPDVLVACIGGLYPTTRKGLMYSTDAGRHFEFIGPSDSMSTGFYRAIFNPNDPNIIYAASPQGVYLTTNRGATWSTILTFPGTNPDFYDNFPDLVMKPDNPSVLIAAQVNLGVSRTADGGVTWSPVDQAMDPTTQASVLAWSPSDPNTVYCERNNPDGQHMVTYVSTNAGVTWSQAANLTFYHQDRYDMALTVDPINASRVVLANGYLGISTDGLKSYAYSNYPHADHLRVVFSPSNPSIAYDANDGGIWRSADAGATWSRIDQGINTNLSFGFDIDPASGQIYLSPGDYSSFQYTPAAGWYNSPRGGEWSKFYIDPTNSATVWHAAAPGGSDLAVSHDRGQTWTGVDPEPKAPRPYRTVVRFSPTQPGTMFFLTNKIWASHDSGATWADLGVRSTNPQFSDMIADSAQPGTLYVSENGGILTSHDGGATWAEHLTPQPWYNVMAPVPGQVGTFYLGNTYGGLYLFSDGGQSAQTLGGALFQSLTVEDLATDPAHPERVYAGTAAGLFFSQDYGQTWQRLGRNLPVTNISQISVKGSTIYAGTSQGIWQFNSDVSWQPLSPVLTVTATSATSISLSWKPGANSTGVRIFRNGVQAYVGVESTYTDLSLTPATNYCYTALDANATGEGPLSSPVCINTAAGGSPSLAVSATSLQFAYNQGGSLPGGQPVQIANGGGGTLSWAASSSIPWLTLSSASGLAPGTLGVEVNSLAKTLAVGVYTGAVSLAAPGIASQPISVALTVYPAPPPPVVVSDFGTNNSYSTSGWCVSGANNPNCGPSVTRYLAAPFVAPSTFAVSNVAVPVSYNSGTNGMIVNLMSDSSGLPGAVLESWSVSNLGAGITSVSSKLNPVLQAGQTYWLEMLPLANDTLLVWYPNNGFTGGKTNINNTGWVPMGTLPAFSITGSSCNITFSPPAASTPATGTSNPAACPDYTQPTCGFHPEVPLTLTVTPTAACGTWTAASSSPAFVQITSGASGNGVGTVTFAVLTNTHTIQRSAAIMVTSGAASASFPLTEAGSADSQLYREVYALYEQLLGRDPDQSGFAFWTRLSTVGLGQMADDFLTSPEAFGTNFAVLAAYQAALGTPPTYAQFSAALANIRAGTQTVGGLFNSLISANYIVANLYQNLLNRQPLSSEIESANAAGLAFWFQTLIGYPAGTSIGAANNEFQSTGTFRTDHTNALYIRMLYFLILSRDPDAGGLNFWVGVANGGGPGILFQGSAGAGGRLAILGLGTPNEGFIGSPEFQGLFAN